MNPFYIQFTLQQKETSQDFIAHVLHGLYRYYISLGGKAPTNPVENTALAQELQSQLKEEKLPLVEQENFPELEAVEGKRIMMTIECAIDIINETVDPFEGEKDIEFAHSYLSENWKEFEKGTGVITRSSSEGIVYFLFPNTVISEEGKINQQLPHFPIQDRAFSNAVNFMKNSHIRALMEAPYDSLVH